ncbi:putative transposase [Nocardioides marinisabuli]|uniref:Putative transposase n=1 Tax=Nocardioides marinisabuli TaxID=419476 RepID=A0A7Y9F0G1_9ACTN|nr:IS3 family transposase [Nocardioides marinisabuli]NYD57056.1 putative transposase [Nocardioides marinisabuli]
MPKDTTAGKPTARRYSPEEKAAAVRMVRTLRAELGTEHGTVQRVAAQLGYGTESVRLWVRQADIDEGHQPGLSTTDAEKLKALGHDVGRDQVARLMRTAGIEGVRRTKRVRTTKPDPGVPRHPDLVGRDFTATAPNQLWVTDLTFVPTWAGIAYVCFIIDAYSRMIVGWRVASHMRTTMVLDAIEVARWSRGTTLTGLRCHSGAGSQFTSIRYGERLAEIGAVPSIGTVGDSYDNALAETVNGYYKAELIRGPAREGRPWKTVEDVELATLSWVHWHNHDRLHGYLNDVPPTEFEETFYAQTRTDQPLVGIQ